VKARIAQRPPQSTIDAALAELLGNIRFANCHSNIPALLPNAHPQ
jgi:hypothetical protein